MNPCMKPPSGWICSREADHEGPCAARPRAFTSDQLAALLIGSQMDMPLCYLCPRFAVDYGVLLPHEDGFEETSAYCDIHGAVEPRHMAGRGIISKHADLARRLNVTIWGE